MPCRGKHPRTISEAELADGAVIALRRIESGDSASVVALYETLTADERYFRFFTRRPAHLAAWALSLTEPSDDRYALGAFAGETLVGVANYVASSTPEAAEVAVVVAHDQHLRGVGTALLHRLAEIARNKGIQHFTADVLGENHPMLNVLSDAGWPWTRCRDGAVLRVDVDLAGVDD